MPVQVLVDSSDEIVGYGCGRLLSIVGRPIFGPIYCDSDDGFKMLFHMLVSCFDEELKEQNTIRLFVPTAKSTTVQHLLQDAASFESVSFQKLEYRIIINGTNTVVLIQWV